jgi:ketosteroid isomerase-like protein
LATTTTSTTETSTIAAVAPDASAEARHADHEELRAMMRTATAALNSRDFTQLSALVSPHCYITTVDGQVFNDLNGFKSYLDKLFASRVTKIDFHPEADELTLFLDADTGLSRGASTDTYHFKDGDTRVMKSRWTATVHREGGKWKLASLHISANVLDNPVVAATKKFAWSVAAAALILGLLLGFLLRGLIRRS